MATATERFEAIGDLYCGRYGRLRPGKLEAPETYRDANSDENRKLFDSWLATDGLMDAIDRIVNLEYSVSALEDTVDELESDLRLCERELRDS